LLGNHFADEDENGGRPVRRPEVEAQIAEPARRMWLAHHDDVAVGIISLWQTVPTDVELGYRLQPSHWGQGLATEGARLLIDIAFHALGAERVWAQTMTVNVASRRVMERCGMRFVRTFFAELPEVIDGSEHGDVEYELLRAEWQAEPPPGQVCGWTSSQKPDQEG